MWSGSANIWSSCFQRFILFYNYTFSVYVSVLSSSNPPSDQFLGNLDNIHVSIVLPFSSHPDILQIVLSSTSSHLETTVRNIWLSFFGISKVALFIACPSNLVFFLPVKKLASAFREHYHICPSYKNIHFKNNF